MSRSILLKVLIYTLSSPITCRWLEEEGPLVARISTRLDVTYIRVLLHGPLVCILFHSFMPCLGVRLLAGCMPAVVIRSQLLQWSANPVFPWARTGRACGTVKGCVPVTVQAFASLGPRGFGFLFGSVAVSLDARFHCLLIIERNCVCFAQARGKFLVACFLLTIAQLFFTLF